MSSRENERVEGLCFDGQVQFAWSADEQIGLGSSLGMSLSLRPISPHPLSIGFLHVLLEEKTVNNISATIKAPVVKRWSMLKLQPLPPNSLLPWTGQSGCSQVDTAMLSAGLSYHEQEQRQSKKSLAATRSICEAEQTVRERLATFAGPWNLSFTATTPTCSTTPVNNSIQHAKSAINVTHRLVLQILFKSPTEIAAGAGTGIELTRPIQILASSLVEPGSALPCYYCECLEDHPYNYDETWRQLAEQECCSSGTSTVLPAWLLRLTRSGRNSPPKANPHKDYAHPHSPEGLQSNSSKMWLDLTSQGQGSAVSTGLT